MAQNNSPVPFLDSDTDPEFPAASPTAHLLDELALYGYRPGQDEPDPRPLPEPDAVQAQLDNAVEALSAMLTGTRLEDDLDDLLWSFVNVFHRKRDRIERELDRNEQAQRRGQAEQDGSEVKSVELERLINQGISLIERRNAFEFVRDHAAELYEAATGSAWRPHTGSMVNHRALTAAVIDSREFLAARRRADAQVLAPAGTCSGAQSKCGGRAIKGTFGRTIGENIGDHERTLSETERTIGETDARSRKPDAHYLRPEAKSLSD